jgi:hypothetical protein
MRRRAINSFNLGMRYLVCLLLLCRPIAWPRTCSMFELWPQCLVVQLGTYIGLPTRERCRHLSASALWSVGDAKTSMPG